jgi:hypothetical protein
MDAAAALPPPDVPTLAIRAMLDAGDAPALLAALAADPPHAAAAGARDKRRLSVRDMSKIAGLLYCPLCRGTLRKPAFLAPCRVKHFFCAECIWRRLSARDAKPTCPSCATHFTPVHIVEDAVLGSIVALLVGEPAALRDAGEGGAAPAEAHAGAKRRADGGAGAGGAAAPPPAGGEAPKLSERYSYRVAEPRPAGFPIMSKVLVSAGPPSMVLNVLCSQAVGRHRQVALLRIARENAAAQSIAGFNPAHWDLTLSCEGVPLADDAATLAAAVRAVHAAKGNTAVAERPEGESGANAGSKEPDQRRAPLADIVITARRVAGP